MPTKGKNNEKINRKPLDFILCIVIFLLLALGIVMVLSASAPSSLSQYREQLLLCFKANNVCSNWNSFNVYNI